MTMSPAVQVVNSGDAWQAEPESEPEPIPEAFSAAIRDANPFATNRVNEPAPGDVDVPAIHASGFDRLTALAAQALRDRSGIGAVLLGGAGVGKSHLLSRLYRWAGESAPDGDGGPRACYVYVHNVLADPDRLPRYLLKYVVSQLAGGGRGPWHQSPLYRVVERAIRQAAQDAGARLDDGRVVRDAYRAWARRESGGAGGSAFVVLDQFYRFAHPARAAEPARRRLAAEAVAWLSGDEIDPDSARALGYQADQPVPVAPRDDQEVRQVLLALTRLAAVGHQPFLLCLDQVENIDPEKLKPFARFLHALLDHATNLLLITSGVQQTLLAYHTEHVIPDAAWDRIAEYQVPLKRINRDEARQVLEARLERFHEPFLELDAVRRRVHEDTLFPLSRPWLETRLGEGIEFRPRDILTWARDAWDDAQARGWTPGGSGPNPPDLTTRPIEGLIDDAVERTIAERVARHRHQPGGLPPDAGNLAGLVDALLGQCRGAGLPYTIRDVERPGKTGAKLPTYDLLVRARRASDGSEVTTGVVFVTSPGASATGALRRLLEDDAPPDHRLLVTDDERRPLQFGAQGAEYYRALGQLGAEQFEHLKINFAEYAALDALREAVSLAQSGDLEIEHPPGTIHPVTAVEVIASHHRRDRYRAHPVLRPLLTPVG